MPALSDVREFRVPTALLGQLVAHAERKLRGDYLDDEVPERKAYGLVGGRLRGGEAELTHVVPLRRNLRWAAEFKGYMDRLMEQAAVPSKTPLERRGWVTDPGEIRTAEQVFERDGATLVGSYHMHRVAWEHDPRRDSCTDLDRALAAGSGLWVFILSMVDPERPVVRAFFEGRNEQEATLRWDAAVGARDDE